MQALPLLPVNTLRWRVARGTLLHKAYDILKYTNKYVLHHLKSQIKKIRNCSQTVNVLNMPIYNAADCPKQQEYDYLCLILGEIRPIMNKGAQEAFCSLCTGPFP